MVRKILFCATCQRRFISVANAITCSACSSKGSSATQCSSPTPLRLAFPNGSCSSTSGHSSPESNISITKDHRSSREQALTDATTMKADQRAPFNTPKETKTIDPRGTENVNNENERNIVNCNNDCNNEVAVEILGYEVDHDDVGVSEGEDEIHCTQLPRSDDEEDNQEQGETSVQNGQDWQQDSYVPNRNIWAVKNDAGTMSTAFKNSRNNDICFICGANLTKIKRRIDHIKRCSKKHGITGRDVKIDNDDEEFVDLSRLENESKPTTNPYSKDRENDWHGDATKCLYNIAGNSGAWASTTSATTAAVPPIPKLANAGTSHGIAKQTTLSSFVQVPMQNLNNILLAGARRVSKVGAIAKQKAQSRLANEKTSKPRKRKRFGMSNYSTSRSCPLYKRITGTDFVCDGFHYAEGAKTKNHFLTHFHADHYGGITSNWMHGTIYCSLPTATLVAQQLGVDKKYIHPLPMFTPTIIESRGKPVTVTLLDANHCPGAIMFLFEVGKKKILHVGDFRWNREFMMQQAPLRALQKGTLDELFLDTTYCNPKYSLPTQDQAIQATMKAFEQEMNQKGKTLHLFGSYTIGKEKMYISVASRFRMKVYVDARRYKILSSLQWSREQLKLLTTRKEEASIWVVPLGDINFKKMPDYIPVANDKPFSFPYKRVVGYRPTGWSMGSKPSASICSTRRKDNVIIHSVPYSEHSSFPELLDCLECLRPQRIVPTVSVSKSDEQVKLLLTSLRQKQTKLKLVP